MPELPEVETTRLGIEPHILHQRVSRVELREPRLRWPVSAELGAILTGQVIKSVARRGKYLLLGTDAGTVIIHLGMSGSLRLVSKSQGIGKHDHVDIEFNDSKILRYTDPRRFGCMLWQAASDGNHPLLKLLGPEPLSAEFTGDFLYRRAHGRKTSIKAFIMDSHVVVGVGNIYANEALFMAGIHPGRAAARISQLRYHKLVASIQQVLQRAIEVGGTTLRDFTNSSGEPGYFKQSLLVYGRGGEECMNCKLPLKEIRLGQRSTVYCSRCQS